VPPNIFFFLTHVWKKKPFFMFGPPPPSHQTLEL
jgi:hypothetical protein